MSVFFRKNSYYRKKRRSEIPPHPHTKKKKERMDIIKHIEFKIIKICINGEIDQVHELEDSLMSRYDSLQVDLRI